MNGQAYLGFRDWRLPTREELNTLISYAKAAGYCSSAKPIAEFLNKEGFTNLSAGYYWMFSLAGPSRALSISFKDGEVRGQRGGIGVRYNW